jgi:hypothetical protein
MNVFLLLWTDNDADLEIHHLSHGLPILLLTYSMYLFVTLHLHCTGFHPDLNGSMSARTSHCAALTTTPRITDSSRTVEKQSEFAVVLS